MTDRFYSWPPSSRENGDAIITGKGLGLGRFFADVADECPGTRPNLRVRLVSPNCRLGFRESCRLAYQYICSAQVLSSQTITEFLAGGLMLTFGLIRIGQGFNAEIIDQLLLYGFVFHE